MTTFIVFLLTFVTVMLIVGSRLRKTDALRRHERAMAVLREMTVVDAAREPEAERFHVRVVRGPLPPAAVNGNGRRAYAGNPSRSQAAASAARRSYVARTTGGPPGAPDPAGEGTTDGITDDFPAPPPPIRLHFDGIDEVPAFGARDGNGVPAGNGSGPGAEHDLGDAPGSENGSGNGAAAPSSDHGPERVEAEGAKARAPRARRVRSAVAGSARRTAVAAAAAMLATVAFSASYGGGDGGAPQPRDESTRTRRPARGSTPTTVGTPEPAAELLGFDGNAAAYAVPPTFRLEIAAVGDCWFRIESGADPSQTFEGILAPGETQSFELTSPVGVRLGNALVVGMKIDGTPLELPAGAPPTLDLLLAPSS